MSRSPQLSEEEVRERIDHTDDPAVLDDLYNFGQTMEKASVEIGRASCRERV